MSTWHMHPTPDMAIAFRDDACSCPEAGADRIPVAVINPEDERRQA